jgi:hypothetical protein
VQIVSLTPVFPWLLARMPLIIDNEFVFRIYGISSVGKRELQQLRLCNSFRGTSLYAHITMYATQIVNLVDKTIPLARRCRIGRIIVLTSYIYAVGRTDSCTELTSNTFLHAILIPVENMATMRTRRFETLYLRVLVRHPGLAYVIKSNLEASQWI